MPKSSEYPEDAERIEPTYVDPDSETLDEVRSDLEDAGFGDDSAEKFAEELVVSEDVIEEINPDDRVGVTTREDVDQTVNELDNYDMDNRRKDSVTEGTAREIGAPTENQVTQARGEAAQRVDPDDGTIRTDPSLDPLAEGEGREIGDITDFTAAGGQIDREAGLQERVEKRGDTGVFVLEDRSTGERYPVSEVDL